MTSSKVIWSCKYWTWNARETYFSTWRRLWYCSTVESLSSSSILRSVM